MNMQTLQIQTTAAHFKRDDWLAELRGVGLDPATIGWTDDGSAAADRVLEMIVSWVRGWRAAEGNRSLMERQGFRYPPVDPDCDLDQDWYCFARWMNREPLFWQYEADYGVLPEAEGLTDEQIGDLLNATENRLAARGVSIAVAEAMPEREIYRWLREELRDRPIEHLNEQMHLTLDGCAGACEECFQRRWCTVALEFDDAAQAACLA